MAFNLRNFLRSAGNVISFVNPTLGQTIVGATNIGRNPNAGRQAIERVQEQYGSAYTRPVADAALAIDRYGSPLLEGLANYNYSTSAYEQRARKAREAMEARYAEMRRVEEERAQRAAAERIEEGNRALEERRQQLLSRVSELSRKAVSPAERITMRRAGSAF